MLITSSRKPSGKTKILCKTLALFFDCRYMTRGKKSLEDVLEEGRENIVLIVGEFHGNPGSLSFYDTKGILYLSLHISETRPVPLPLQEIRKGQIGLALSGAAASGSTDDGNTAARSEVLYRLFSGTVFEGFVPENVGDGRLLTISDDCLTYAVKGQVFLKLYIKGMKTY